MKTIACPRCKLAVAADAAACPHCGLLSPAFAVPPPPATEQQGRSASKVVAMAAVGFVVFVFVIGIVAAVVVPRFANAGAGAGSAIPVMRQIAFLQVAQKERTGAYAPSLDELEGWDGDLAGEHFSITLSRSDETGVCIDAVPLATARSSGATPISMDHGGYLYDGLGCQEANLVSADG